MVVGQEKLSEAAAAETRATELARFRGDRHQVDQDDSVEDAQQAAVGQPRPCGDVPALGSVNSRSLRVAVISHHRNVIIIDHGHDLHSNSVAVLKVSEATVAVLSELWSQ